MALACLRGVRLVADAGRGARVAKQLNRVVLVSIRAFGRLLRFKHQLKGVCPPWL